MKTESLSRASEEFNPCLVGEYVAWWCSTDGCPSSITAVSESYPTVEALEAEANKAIGDPYFQDEDGNDLDDTHDLCIYLVVADEDYIPEQPKRGHGF